MPENPRLHCLKCHGQRTHTLLKTVDKTEDNIPNDEGIHGIWAKTEWAIASCNECQYISFVERVWFSEYVDSYTGEILPSVVQYADGKVIGPEPSMPPQDYDEILNIIQDFGVAAERQPDVYGGKDEEALRDLFLAVLCTRFRGTTGETFNKTGKTDILVREGHHNVFVAECKIWHGEKQFLEAIDQLMGYLTWRDSKTAILLFVQNRSFQDVLDQIEEVVRKHPCCVSLSGKRREGWFDFFLHLPGDNSRMLQTAVMCFHFPLSDREQTEGT